MNIYLFIVAAIRGPNPSGTRVHAVIDDGGELCIQVRWIDAPAAASTSKRKIVGEVQKLTLEQWKVYEASKQ